MAYYPQSQIKIKRTQGNEFLFKDTNTCNLQQDKNRMQVNILKYK